MYGFRKKWDPSKFKNVVGYPSGIYLQTGFGHEMTSHEEYPADTTAAFRRCKRVDREIMCIPVTLSA